MTLIQCVDSILDDRVRFCDELERYKAFSNEVDIVNALYNYSQETRSPQLLMKDLCDALEVDGCYRVIDDAFKLPSLKSPLSVYRTRLRIKLSALSTLASEHWETAYEWSRGVHMRSKSGFEYFKLQQFRERLSSLRLCESDITYLLKELSNQPVPSTTFMPFMHSRLGFMPSYFSGPTKKLYSDALNKALAVAAANTKRILSSRAYDEENELL